MRSLRGVVGRDGGFSDVCPRLVAGVVGPVWAGLWWWLWLDCLVVGVLVGGPDDVSWVCGGGWACMVVGEQEYVQVKAEENGRHGASLPNTPGL